MSSTPPPAGPKRTDTLLEPDSTGSPSLSPTSPQPPGSPRRTDTLLETDEDVRQALAAAGPQPPTAPAAGIPQAPPRVVCPDRPTQRPPVAYLTVFDDGKADGELVRVRGDRFVIGRSEGDFLLPHDEQVSGRHVEITRQHVGGAYRWVISDLQSTNGLFVRISRTALTDRTEFLVGKGRYLFEGPAAERGTADSKASAAKSSSPRAGSEDAAPHPSAVLVELLAGRPGARVPLTRPEYWIGADPACAICRSDDSFAELWHVRLFRDGKGAWHAESQKSLNGLWLRVGQITVDKRCLFQIGEQRFRLVVGG
jgi:hypothetical protein